MKEFMLIIRGDFSDGEMSQADIDATVREWTEWYELLEASKVLVTPGGPTGEDGRIVKATDGSVTNGIDTTSKFGAVCGFLTVAADDIDAAVAIAKGCPLIANPLPSVNGHIEIREIEDM